MHEVKKKVAAVINYKTIYYYVHWSNDIKKR